MAEHTSFPPRHPEEPETSEAPRQPTGDEVAALIRELAEAEDTRLTESERQTLHARVWEQMAPQAQKQEIGHRLRSWWGRRRLWQGALVPAAAAIAVVAVIGGAGILGGGEVPNLRSGSEAGQVADVAEHSMPAAGRETASDIAETTSADTFLATDTAAVGCVSQETEPDDTATTTTAQDTTTAPPEAADDPPDRQSDPADQSDHAEPDEEAGSGEEAARDAACGRRR